jgi:outer membrane protein assembly factor BamB
MRVLVALLALSGCAAPADWPRWRGPDGNGVADGAPLPVAWTVAWKTAVPGEGSSSPIVSGDAVFLTSAKESGGRRILHCFDRRSGASRWSREIEDKNPERASALTGHAAATPVTDGERVVASFGNAGVMCTTTSGRLLWHERLGEFDSELGLASSPILHRGLVLLVCDHDGDSYLLALDVATGKPVWKTPRPGLGRSWSTPILVGNELIVSAQDDVKAYDPLTGKALWSLAATSGWVAPSPVSGGGRIFVVSGKDGPVVALNREGRVVWKEDRGGPYVGSPVYYDGLLYFVDDSSRLVCREGATGTVVYRERLAGKFTSSPVAGDGKIYLTNEEGTTTVVKAGPAFVVLAENRLGEEVLASPAISGGELLIRTRSHLWCLTRN